MFIAAIQSFWLSCCYKHGTPTESKSVGYRACYKHSTPKGVRIQIALLLPREKHDEICASDDISA
jgi:hypothetical protein